MSLTLSREGDARRGEGSEVPKGRLMLALRCSGGVDERVLRSNVVVARVVESRVSVREARQGIKRQGRQKSAKSAML